MAETPEATEMVTIPAARLAELEAQVAGLTKETTTLREKLARRANHNIERLKAYEAAHAEDAAARNADKVKRWIDKNRDAYNARRRELRRLKREAGAVHAAIAPTTAVVKPA